MTAAARLVGAAVRRGAEPPARGAIAAIRSAFEDARVPRRRAAAEGTAGVPKHDADARWDAMRRVVRGEVPVFFHADHVAQIRSLLAFVDDAAQARRDRRRPRRVDARSGAQGARHRGDRRGHGSHAGPALGRVRRGSRCRASSPRRACASASRTRGGSFNAANVRNLPHHAGYAARRSACRARTRSVGHALPGADPGVADRIGSIEPGKIADLQVTDGDPLETATQCLAVFRRRPPGDHGEPATRLFHKYDSRPAAGIACARAEGIPHAHPRITRDLRRRTRGRRPRTSRRSRRTMAIRTHCFPSSITMAQTRVTPRSAARRIFRVPAPREVPDARPARDASSPRCRSGRS